MAEKVLRQATFNPKVKRYWFVTFCLVSFFTVIGLPLLIIITPFFFVISTKLINAMSATLTERKLIVKRGVLFKEEKTIPLEKITDVSMSQGPLMKAFDLYRLSFETAGQSAAGALVSMIGIDDAADFREAILTQKDVASSHYSEPKSDNQSEMTDLQTLTQSVVRIEAMLSELLTQKNTSE